MSTIDFNKNKVIFNYLEDVKISPYKPTGSLMFKGKGGSISGKDFLQIIDQANLKEIGEVEKNQITEILSKIEQKTQKMSVISRFFFKLFKGKDLAMQIRESLQKIDNKGVLFLIETLDNEQCFNSKGIYRISGQASRYASIDLGRGQDAIEGLDVNDLASLLKKKIREKNGLIPLDVVTKINQLGQNYEATDIQKIIQEIPEYQQEVLKKLMLHLNKVAAHSEQNQMPADNLAALFAPTLLPEGAVDRGNVKQQAKHISFLIQHAKEIFSQEATQTAQAQPVQPALMANPPDVASMTPSIESMQGHEEVQKIMSCVRKMDDGSSVEWKTTNAEGEELCLTMPIDQFKECILQKVQEGIYRPTADEINECTFIDKGVLTKTVISAFIARYSRENTIDDKDIDYVVNVLSSLGLSDKGIFEDLNFSNIPNNIRAKLLLKYHFCCSYGFLLIREMPGITQKVSADILYHEFQQEQIDEKKFFQFIDFLDKTHDKQSVEDFLHKYSDQFQNAVTQRPEVFLTQFSFHSFQEFSRWGLISKNNHSEYLNKLLELKNLKINESAYETLQIKEQWITLISPRVVHEDSTFTCRSLELLYYAPEQKSPGFSKIVLEWKTAKEMHNFLDGQNLVKTGATITKKQLD